MERLFADVKLNWDVWGLSWEGRTTRTNTEKWRKGWHTEERERNRRERRGGEGRMEGYGRKLTCVVNFAVFAVF
jgi:hypothetical protein